jgi:hypothetical protein
MTVYGYSGTVVELGSRRPVVGARIEAWDIHEVCHDLVDCAFTDAEGAFRFALDAALVDELLPSGSPVAFFKVFNGSTLLADTRAHLSWRVRETNASGRIEIAQGTRSVGKDNPAPWIVRGRVMHARTGPIQSAVVSAAHKGLRATTPLGQGTTDARGLFQITYSTDALLEIGKQKADLEITVHDRRGAPLVGAQIVFHAPATARVDFVVGGSSYVGPTDAATLLHALQRSAPGIRPAALSDVDQTFLASAESLDPAALRALVAADTLANGSPDAMETLYGVGRAGIAVTAEGIFRAARGAVRRALETAVAKNHVMIPDGKTLDDLENQVHAAAVRAAVVKSADGLVASLGDVLSTVVTAPAAQHEFLTTYLKRTSTEDFWAGLGKNPTFSQPATVDALRLSMDIASVTGQHLPLINALLVGKVAGTITKLRDLAKLDASDWSHLLGQSYDRTLIGAPASATGATPTERITSYAAHLASSLRKAFPTSAIAGHLTKQNRSKDADVRAFLAGNPEFDFGSARVAAHLAKNPRALANTIDVVAATASLRKMERVFKLTSKAEEIDVLLQGGVNSAHAVIAMGASAFREQFGRTLHGSVDEILANASFTVTAVRALAAKYGAGNSFPAARSFPTNVLTQPPVFVDGPVSANPPTTVRGPAVYLPPEMADWEELFGTVDSIHCDECTSVLGPAAYLVDILDFLGQIPSSIHKNAKAPTSKLYSARDLLIGASDKILAFQLVGRRPDIGRIALDCANATTPVPYIDLLNEILECKVALVGEALKLTQDPAQTTGDPADLAVNRQILEGESAAYTAAYATLATATYPWSLPVDRARLDATAHLSLVGAPPPLLLRTFQPVAATPPTLEDQEAAFEIAAVSLGLNPVDRAILVDQNQAPPWIWWNLSAADWPGKLLTVSTFLDHAGLTYPDLQELLDTRLLVPFLANAASPPTITSSNAKGANGDLDYLVISGLATVQLPALWSLLHRFLRLQVKTGLTITELDKILAAFTTTGAGIDDSMLQRLSVIVALRTELGVSLAELLSWWGPVDCRPSPLTRQPTLFDQTFLNPALSNDPASLTPDEAAFVAIRDATTHSTIPKSLPSGELLSKHASRIAAASQISAVDVALLTDVNVSVMALGIPGPLDVTAQFTLDNVSTVFRYASLARALGLSIGELLQLKSLASADPFNATDLTQATLFIKEAHRVRDSAFTLLEIGYLLGDRVDPTGPSSLAAGQADAFMKDLVPALSKIVADTQIAVDPTGAITKKLLGKWLDQPTAENVHKAIAGLPDPSTGLLDVSAAALIITASLGFLAPSVALHLNADLTTHPDAVADRYGYLAAKLLPLIRRTDSIALVERKLAAALKLTAPMAKALLTSVLQSGAGSTQYAIEDFLPPSAPETIGLAISDLGSAVPTFLRLQKAAMLVQKLDVGVDEIPLVIPLVDPAAAPNTLFQVWGKTIDTFALRGRVQAGPKALFELFEFASQTPTWPPFRDHLSVVTGWSVADLDAHQARFGFSYPSDFVDATAYLKLADAFALLQQLGVSATTAIAWADSFLVKLTPAPLLPYSDQTATDIKKAAKAHYNAEGWLAAEKPVNDRLRDRQRAALVSYLLVHTLDKSSQKRVYREANDIYADLLVDVQTSPSVQTSRLVQATGSAQLFVQRCLLGLEPVTLSAYQADQWSWMKFYRVWEANRQVFLYPENWILPALRDDKTDLFKTLEATLQKQAVTSDAAEGALRTYLEALLEVSNLDIAAVYHEPADAADGDSIDHVFGRTRATPVVYYHRTWVGRRQWTAWEKLPVSIEGEVVLPLAYEGRLFLFWPILKAKNDPPTDFSVPTGTVTQAKQHLEIQFAWSERKHDHWTGKKLARDFVTVSSAIVEQMIDSLYRFGPWGLESAIRSGIFFTTEVNASGPRILCGLSMTGDHSAYTPKHWDIHGYVGEASLDLCAGIASCRTYDTRQDFPRSLPDPTWLYFDQTRWIQPVKAKYDYSPNVVINLEIGPGSNAVFWSLPIPYSVVCSRQGADFDGTYPFIFQDANTTFLIEPRDPEQWYQDGTEKIFRLYPHYQPHVCSFLETLNRYGLTGTRRWSTHVKTLQVQSLDLIGGSAAYPYQPGQSVSASYSLPHAESYPKVDVDFTFCGAYSQYNWELFFHIPLLLATKLSENRKFEAAHAWFQTIFDPTAGAGSNLAKVREAAWKVRPFWENKDLASLTDDIRNLLPATNEAKLLKDLVNGTPNNLDLTWDFAAQILEWQHDPFNPHHIARMRPVAYQKMVVMRFLDNLIAWGDHLFTEDTIESINNATQLYVLAAEILGPRPTMIPPLGAPATKTYWQLVQAGLTDFGDATVALESLVPTSALKMKKAWNQAPSSGSVNEPPPGMKPPSTGLYFCVPPNDQLLAYWDTVADRLFKIRHAMNIAGIVQQLPLFAPPIDPALLVAATAAGVDIDSVLEDISGPVPVYRFAALLPKAQEVAAGVAQLGSSLLAALEKGDAEGLAQLRAGQELTLLQLISDVKQRQVDEAQANVDALTVGLAVVAARQAYYHGRAFMNAAEIGAVTMSATATIAQAVGATTTAAGGAAHLLPTGNIGTVGPLPITLAAEGGSNSGNAGVTAGQVLGIAAGILHEAAATTATMGAYQRRMDDWQFQAQSADTEHGQVAQQLLGAQIRLDIATKELANHERQIENAQAIRDFVQGKATNQDLYDWMSGQISAVYFQAYQMAYQVAKRAEKAYQIELAVPGVAFVDFGNWDNQRQGLLAGEKLQFDLRRMELQYLDENRRELEITKYISLAQSFPNSLLELALTGTTTLSLPESLFDADYPGHYLRRLRTVSLSLPGVAGPYASVNCTLTQTASSLRKDTLNKAASVVQSYVNIQRVVTSSGTNDAGLFELNLHDERYLPFEGSGVVSTWRIDLPAATNAFDVAALDDVVMQIRYTARDGGDEFRKTRANTPATGTWLVRASADQATAWYAFKNSPANASSQSLVVDLSSFPYLPGGGSVSVTNLEVLAQGRQGALLPLSFTVSATGMNSTPTLKTSTSASFTTSTLILPPLPQVVSPSPPGSPWEWTLAVAPAVDLTPLVELWIRVTYKRVP